MTKTIVIQIMVIDHEEKDSKKATKTTMLRAVALNKNDGTGIGLLSDLADFLQSLEIN